MADNKLEQLENELQTRNVQYDRTVFAVLSREILKYKGEVDIPSFVEEHLRRRDEVTVASILLETGMEANPAEVARTCRWAEKQGIAYRNTLDGKCISTADAPYIMDAIRNAVLVKPMFFLLCQEQNVKAEISDYTRFLRMNRAYYNRATYHPLGQYIDLWTDLTYPVEDAISMWIALQKASAAEPTEHMNLDHAADKLGITAIELAGWLQKHPRYIIKDCGAWYIRASTVAKIVEELSTAVSLESVISLHMREIPTKDRKPLTTKVKEKLVSGEFSDLLQTLDDYPAHKPGLWVMANNIDIVSAAVEEEINNAAILPLKILAPITGLRADTLQNNADEGVICAEVTDGNYYYISIAERTRIQRISDQYICIDQAVEDAAQQWSDAYKISKKPCRDDLIQYAEEQDWWSLDIAGKDAVPLKSKHFELFVRRDQEEHLRNQLRLYMKLYKVPYDVAIDTLLTEHQFQFPDTTKKLKEFFCDRKLRIEKDRPAKDMVECLYGSIEQDLRNMTESELEDLIQYDFSAGTISAQKLFATFLKWGGFTTREYEIKGTGVTVDTSAYTLEQWVTIMLPCVMQSVWEEYGLIEKAVDNEKYSSLWLFISLHLYAVWRGTDFVALNAPQLPMGYTPDRIFSEVREGKFPSTVAEDIARRFQIRAELECRKPNKTKKYSNVPDLVMHVPESFYHPFGVILAIAAAHYYSSGRDTFVVPVNDGIYIKQFFGDEIYAACGRRAFSTRKANKSLLQGIEHQLREEQHMDGGIAYKIAAMFRSHKYHYGTLAETTSIYLRDASFMGDTPEYIIGQMFERGVCSFHIDGLMKRCYGDQYNTLSIRGKTEALKTVNLTNLQVANVRELVEKGMERSEQVLTNIFQGNTKSMMNALIAIANGSAVGKDPHVLCLCSAIGRSCACPDRGSCVGCGYEILTKTFGLHLISLVQELRTVHPGDTAADMARNAYLLRRVVGKAFAELMVCSDQKGTQDERSFFMSLMGGFDNGTYSQGTA